MKDSAGRPGDLSTNFVKSCTLSWRRLESVSEFDTQRVSAVLPGPGRGLEQERSSSSCSTYMLPDD